MALSELALFAGAGGGILGGLLSGPFATRCAVELDPYARSVLLARQRDGCIGRFPVWDDVRTFDGKPWRGRIDVITGGFPCQSISACGDGEGISGASSGLWFDMLRIIKDVQPRFVFAENSPQLRTRGLGTVIKGLANLGYDYKWCVLGSRHIGGPTARDRMWILANLNKERCQEHCGAGSIQAKHTPTKCRDNTGSAMDSLSMLRESLLHNPRDARLRVQLSTDRGMEERPIFGPGPWGAFPGVFRVDNGMADRVDRLKALGNGQVPAVAALAWRVLGGPVVT